MRIVYALFIIIFSSIALAEQITLEIPGTQLHPSIYGRYIVYMQDIGNGKYDIDVYDSGLTTDTADDLGVIELTTDGATHNYAEPVIDGRYIAWLDKIKTENIISKTVVHVYDMGDDEIIDRGAKVINKLNTFDNIKGRDYTQKSELHLSKGVLVWQDYDNNGWDSDIRGYDLNVPGDAASDVNDPHHQLISDEKMQTLNGLTERIDESYPFISGNEVVFASSYLHPFEEFAEVNQEIYKKDISTGEKTLVSDPESGYSYATMPSIDSGSVLWVDYFAPSQAILYQNDVVFSTQDGNVLYPRRDRGVYLFILEAGGELSLYINNQPSEGGSINPLNEYSADYSVYDSYYTFSSGVPGHCIAFDYSNALLRLAGTYEKQLLAPLGNGKVLVYMKDDQGLKAKVEDINEGKEFIPVATGQNLKIFNPISDGLGGGILPWKDVKSYYARFVDKDGNFGEPVRVIEKDDLFIDTFFYPDNSGGALMYNYFDTKTIVLFSSDGTDVVTSGEPFDNPKFLGLGKRKALVMSNADMDEPVKFHSIDKGSIYSEDTYRDHPSSWDLISDGKGGAIAYINYYLDGKITSSILFFSGNEIKDTIEFPYNELIRGIYLDETLGLLIFFENREPPTRSSKITYLKDGIFSDPVTIFEDGAGPYTVYPFRDEWMNALFLTNEFNSYSKLVTLKDESIEVHPIIGEIIGPDLFSPSYFRAFLKKGDQTFVIVKYFKRDPQTFVYDLVASSVFEIRSKVDSVFPQQPHLLRGDTNNDGKRNIADAVTILGYLFLQGDAKPKVSCLDTLDANDDGILNIADAVRLLGHLFSNTGPLPEPFNAPGEDPTGDGIGCECYGTC